MLALSNTTNNTQTLKKSLDWLNSTVSRVIDCCNLHSYFQSVSKKSKAISVFHWDQGLENMGTFCISAPYVLMLQRSSIKKLLSSHAIALHSKELSKWAQDGGFKNPLPTHGQPETVRCILQTVCLTKCTQCNRAVGYWKGYRENHYYSPCERVYVCFEGDESWKTGFRITLEVKIYYVWSIL